MLPKGSVYLAFVPVFLIVVVGFLWGLGPEKSGIEVPVVLMEDTVPSFRR